MKHWETYSNLAIVAVGVYIIFHASLIWGLGVVLMGLGSMYGHHTGDYFADWFGMYAAYLAQIIYFTHDWFIFGASPALFFLSVFHYRLRNFKYRGVNGNFIAIGILYAITFILSFWNVEWLIALSSGAFYLSALAMRGVNHGMWHVIVAVAILILVI